MKNLLLVGGMGTGKTTFARKTVEEFGKLGLTDFVNLLQVSPLVTTIPMALQEAGLINLESISKTDFINIVLENKDLLSNEGIKIKNYSLREMDAYGYKISYKFGSTVIGEIAKKAMIDGRINVIDNIPMQANVEYLKESGLYVVGLTSTFEEQIQRSLTRERPIGPNTPESMREQVISTNTHFEIQQTVPLADIIYSTSGIKENYTHAEKKFHFAEVFKTLYLSLADKL